MKQNSAKIVAMAGIIFCLSSLLAFVLFYLFIEKEKDDFYERNIARERARAQNIMLEGLSKTLGETKVDRESLEARVLQQNDLFTFLAKIESLGQIYNVILETKDLREIPISDNKTFETFVVDVVVSGEYQDVLTVLSIFETLPYQANVEKVTLEKQTEETWSSSYELRITQFKKV